MNEKKRQLGSKPASFGTSFLFVFPRGEDKGKDGGVKHGQQKEQQEESKCVGGKGKRGRRERARSMEGNTASKEREMMGLIRIKTAGFLDNPELGPTCPCQLPSRLPCQAAAQIICSGTCREPR